MSEEPIKQTNVIRLWAQKYPEVTRWLSKIRVKDKSAFSLYRYCQWAKKTPQQLLALKDDPSSKDAERLLDDFTAADVPLTNPAKFNIVNTVKSFYKWNYKDLARASGVITLEKVKPYNKLTKEGLRKLWSWVRNPRDKALLTFVCSTAVAKETLTLLKWQHLEDDWEKKDLPCLNIPSELLKGHGAGRYKGVRQTTFLTPEAKRDLINYKEWIENKLGREVKPDDNIFLSTHAPYDPLSYMQLGFLVWDLAKQTKVPFGWHDARRWVNTALEQIGISPNWARKIRGRKVRGEEAPYSQPSIDALREKFREAVPLLEFTSETPMVPKEVREKLLALEEETRRIKAEYQLRSKTKKTAKSEGDCEDDQHCGEFEQIPEAQLIEHLRSGWQIVQRLSDGAFIVTR